MLYYLSRLLRYNDKNLPKINRCRAHLWIHYGSYNEKCDCNIWCKYPPTDKISFTKLNFINNFNKNIFEKIY